MIAWRQGMLASEDAQAREAAIREAGAIVRAAHHAVTGE